MVRVDAHVHAFPDRLALAVRDKLNGEGRLTGSPLLAALTRSVQEAGFHRAWVLPYAHREGVAESINDWSATEVAAMPSLVAGATFHPADPDIARLVDRALGKRGLRVVKLHCSVGQFSPADQRLIPLWETASALGAPVVIHAGQASPGETSATELDELEPVLAGFPALRVVLAHAGHPNTARALELMERHRQLHADLTPVWDQPVAIPLRDLERFPGRFLFGSDAPNNPVPAATQAERVQAIGLPAGVLAQLMGGAAEALIPPL